MKKWSKPKLKKIAVKETAGGRGGNAEQHSWQTRKKSSSPVS